MQSIFLQCCLAIGACIFKYGFTLFSIQSEPFHKFSISQQGSVHSLPIPLHCREFSLSLSDSEIRNHLTAYWQQNGMLAAYTSLNWIYAAFAIGRKFFTIVKKSITQLYKCVPCVSERDYNCSKISVITSAPLVTTSD